MLSEYKRRTNIGVGLGLVLVAAAKYLSLTQQGAGAAVSVPLWVIGLGFFVWGSAQYAKGKGHSPWWGALGLLYILGFVVLFFLPDRHKAPSTS